MSHQLARIQQQPQLHPLQEQQPSSTAAARGSTNSDSHSKEGRTLLRSLTFHRVLYVSEAFTSKKYNASSNMLRKNYENFVLLKHKQALVTPGSDLAQVFLR